MRFTKIVQLDRDDRSFYGCAECHEIGRDVDATVAVEGTYGILNYPLNIYMCGNHAECIPLESEEHKS